MPRMVRHPGFLAFGLVLPCFLVVSCGSDSTPSPPRVDAARDTRAADGGIDAPPSSTPDAPAPTPDASPEASPDTPPPRPDVRPDYASSGLPSIAAIAPALLPTAPAADTDFAVSGTDFAADAVVFFGGQMLATTRVSPERLTARITAALVPQAGAYAVQVESGAADARARSNIVYFTLMPAAGGPEILGYTPDNGIPGDVVRIVGNNLVAAPVMISGPGNVMVTPGAAERTSWNSAPTTANVDAVPITLPAGWQTGPIVVTTPAGTYRGPIFWTGTNLAKLGDVMGAASSQYASMPFFASSARDNDLRTSWYTATGNCASGPSCTLGPPTFSFTFPALQPIARLAVRGLRDQYRGTWDYLRARFELLDAPDGTPVFVGSFAFPAPERDYDVILTKPISARVVRLVAEEDLSTGPGLAEIEVFPPEGQGLVPAPDGGAPADGGPDASPPDGAATDAAADSPPG